MGTARPTKGSKMTPDELCAAANAEEIKIKMTHEADYIVIEGDTKTLEFLGNLFIAQAKFQKDCGFQMAYGGAGSSFFVPSSNVGLCIHRIPCLNHKPEKPGQLPNKRRINGACP